MNKILLFFGFGGARVTPLSGGLINQTFLVEKGHKKIILQRLSPIFKIEVLQDIQAITGHLEKMGITTAKLVTGANAKDHFIDTEGFIWRALTFLPGTCHSFAPTAGYCFSAGRLLGHYHLVLQDFSYTFQHVRPHVHDSFWHFAQLEEVMDRYPPNWSRRQELQQITEKLLAYKSHLLNFTDLPLGIVHGDPKITNFLFLDTRASTIIDLDTFAKRALLTELGDALRSFANTAAEDEPGHFDNNYFCAFCSGYQETNPQLFSTYSLDDIRLATRTITLELAARFAKEAFCPQNFAWDPNKFNTASDHNLARCKNQLALAEAI